VHTFSNLYGHKHIFFQMSTASWARACGMWDTIPFYSDWIVMPSWLLHDSYVLESLAQLCRAVVSLASVWSCYHGTCNWIVHCVFSWYIQVDRQLLMSIFFKIIFSAFSGVLKKYFTAKVPPFFETLLISVPETVGLAICNIYNKRVRIFCSDYCS